MNLLLKRVDDGHELAITSNEKPVRRLEQGRTAYEAGYRRIVHEKEVPPGRARIFETGGNFVLVGRNGGDVFAFDAHPLIQREKTPHLVYAQNFIVETGGSGVREPRQLQPLATATEDGWIWVDVEAVSR